MKLSFNVYFVDELDSYMYQTVGHQGIELYAEAMGLPLYREVITGAAVDQGRSYEPTENDEVEDLYRLLSRIKVQNYIRIIIYVFIHCCIARVCTVTLITVKS